MILPIAALPLWFTDTVAVVQGVLSLVACLLLLLAVPLVIRLRRSTHETADRAEVVARKLLAELSPLLRDAAVAVSQLNEILGGVRGDARSIHATVQETTDTVRSTVASVHARIERLGRLVDVVEDELEGAVLTAVAAVRRARTGASFVGRGARYAVGRLIERIARGAFRLDGSDVEAESESERAPRPYRRIRL